jgi:choline dehydrogenase-like flavoprotein
MQIHSSYDVIIIGAGVSGSFMAKELAEAGWKTLILEAGHSFTRSNYPKHEIDSNSQMYWGGGVELYTSASLTILRPKVVGGGSIVNQALMDRFDDIALDSWRETSKMNIFSEENMKPWYEVAESELVIQKIPEQYRNGNAKIFADGFAKNGFTCSPLIRAQKDCHFEDGNDCISCLAGCPIDSKQSMPVTVLRKALKAGASLISEFEVKKIEDNKERTIVGGKWKDGSHHTFSAKKIVMAAGAIGNSKLLLQNDFKKSLPSLGENFYTHPQYMVMAFYDHEINAHKGPFQSYKSHDKNFRARGFKLENVFAPPVALSLLIPSLGKKHLGMMKRLPYMACIEVAVRDTNPGKITVNKLGRTVIEKELNSEDLKRKSAGLDAISAIFASTGAREVIEGDLGLGLHLMGGCGIGTEEKNFVTAPDFTIHGHRRMLIADSSIFPNAPGINPSLTIMALSKIAAHNLIKEGV